MIYAVIASIGAHLSEYLRNELGLQEDPLVITSLVDVKGTVSSQIENKVCLFLRHIEEERIAKSGNFQANPGMAPTMYINLYMMAAANYPDTNYGEGLRMISMIIEFFQGRAVIDRSNSSLLPDGVDKISIEMVNMDFNELSNLWNLVGAKYIPSVLYKVKMLAVSQGSMRSDVSRVIKGQTALIDKVRELKNRVGGNRSLIGIVPEIHPNDNNNDDEKIAPEE